jgi:hypothetical protein
MGKCRYILEDQLPPPATEDQMRIVNQAINSGKVKVLGKAVRFATYVWKISLEGVGTALKDHVQSGCRIFRKYENNSNRLLPNKLQANVNLDGESDDDRDVYMEIILTETEILLISNAHNHDQGQPRLPK